MCLAFVNYFLLIDLARSRSNGSRLQTGLVSRRRSRRLKKRVHFQKEIHSVTSPNYTRCTAARSLFSTKTITDLPNELMLHIVMYFDAKELMNLRCVCIYMYLLNIKIPYLGFVKDKSTYWTCS